MPKAIHLYEVLRRPIVTEKSTMLAAHRKYVFEVAVGANKPQIKEAVEQAFSVTVEAVNTAMGHGRRKRTRQGRMSSAEPTVFKRAVVTIAAGQTIEFFEGV
ncbi:MAG: 50S ribosomal protein L23 [Dehalococcoidia bacterium]|nr:50S ribosomal protein L23 [Dehalococcoidia bacterium]